MKDESQQQVPPSQPREYTEAELLDKCLDRMSYYQKAYMDLQLEVMTVIRSVHFDKSVGYLSDNVQDAVAKIYLKHQTCFL